MTAFERNGEVQLGTTDSPFTEKAEMEREEKRRRTDEVGVVVRQANNQPKRIRPLNDLIGAHERSNGNVLFPVFPETENTIWTPLPNLPGKTGISPETNEGGITKHSVQIIGNEQKNFATTNSPNFVREVSSKEKTTTPLQRVAPPSVSSRVVYFSDKETSPNGKGSEKLGSESGGFDRVRLGRVSSLISKSARDFNQKKRQEGSPYRYDII